MNEVERKQLIDSIQMELFVRKAQLEKQIEQLELDFKAKLELVKSQGTKVCRRCKQERPIGMFYVETRYKDDHRPYCMICDSAMASARYRKKVA